MAQVISNLSSQKSMQRDHRSKTMKVLKGTGYDGLMCRR